MPHTIAIRRYFQILYRTKNGCQRLTASIVMRDSPELTPEHCLKHTTQFVQDNLISIWEVAA